MPKRRVFVAIKSENAGAEDAHRIVEVACVEVVDGLRTGNILHLYINPDGAINQPAIDAHGRRGDLIGDKPRFQDVASDLSTFLHGAEIFIHNVECALRSLNNELVTVVESILFEGPDRVLDTLQIARARYPGASCDLHALCGNYGIERSDQDSGALQDAEMLAELVFAMDDSASVLTSELLPSKLAKGVDIRITFPWIERPDGFGRTIYQEALKALCNETQSDHLVHFGLGGPHLYVATIDEILCSIPFINETDYWYPTLSIFCNGRDITPLRELSWGIRFINPTISLKGEGQLFDRASWMNEPPCPLESILLSIESDIEYSIFGH